MTQFSTHERRILERLAEAVIPPGRTFPGGGAETVRQLERYLAGVPPWAFAAARAGVWAYETSAVPFTGRPFTRLSLDARIALLERWNTLGIATLRLAQRALVAGLKSAHFDNEAAFATIGARYGTPEAADENPRWLAQVTDGRSLDEPTELEADVVIVGTGAGGAPLAYELAMRGHAVVMIEEGRYFRRGDFTGHAAEMTRTMYRDGGMTIALGNIAAPVWAGVTVGGTTTVNSGTCYRTPERTFKMWRDQFGLAMFSSESMDRHFARVERILSIEPGREPYLGGVARVVARGADALGWVHKPLRRNAPDCDGQGLCCFGCPTGAKKSTDVSYVPMALERGAALFSSTKVDRVLIEKGRAVGVEGHTKGGGKITIRARATVLACGTMMTPLLLLGQNLANRSGMVGKNLSIHPAGASLALFDERIDMHRGIPQGYAVEQFAESGMMLEGASTPLDITAIALSFAGRRFMEVMEQYPYLASFGYMIQDTSRGRVMRGPNGRLLMFYKLNEDDTRRLQRSVEALCELYLAAGARCVFPGVYGFDEIRTPAELAKLKAHRLRAGDFDVTAYHPLGTARMGTDPATSVVSPDHETHDVRDLFIVDGSAVPSSLGVNPQLTIMAMATRAAEILDRRLATHAVPEQHESAMHAASA
jgi:choline dehydrogenase-like flavoprotein